MHVDETIVAVASSHEGNGLRGIVRVSGPETVACVRQIFSGTFPAWHTSTRPTRHPGQLQLGGVLGRLDCDLYLWPTSRSYTQQPTAELHTFGARPLLEATVDALSRCGARLARPGEFTMRAFLAGRIDLAQAEAVLGVIDAASDRELNVALQQLAGGLTQPLTRLRDTLLNLCADLEAGLDFVDEDLEFISPARVASELSSAQQLIEHTLQQVRSRDTGKQLPRVVLRGEPNAGKSSLWNAIVGAPHAIVTNQAGTTRDYLIGTVTRAGAPFSLIDTAGVESSPDELQRLIRQGADQQAESADLVLLCMDASRPRTSWERDEQARLRGTHHMLVATKCDHASSPPDFRPDAETSAFTGRGIDELIASVAERLEFLRMESAVVASTATRCLESLRLAHQAVQQALAMTRTRAGDELVASELRIALDHMGHVVGAVYTEDILDRVFSRFCIGK